MTDETPDEVLAARAAGGDADAFRTIYERYRHMVFTLALRMTGSDADAEDLLQTAFLRVHRALPGFRGDSKLSTWLWRVTLSVALSERRSSRRRPAPLDVTEAPEPAASGPRPGDAAERRDEAAWVQRHLQSLPPRDRAILHLRYGLEKSFEEISEMMQIPAGTAKSLVFRAKAELRRNMERERDDL